MRARDHGIDWLKALAITLMVTGHAIQYPSGKDFDSNLLFRLIYSFHMPLFMFISGYLVYGNNTTGFIRKQFKVLVIPFVVWMILYSFYFRRFDLLNGNWDSLPASYLQTLKIPSKGLWFLWTLFLIDVIYCFLSKSRHFYLWTIAVITFLYVLTTIYPSCGYYGINFVKFYYPYFVLGILIRQYDLIQLIRGKILILLSGLIVFLEIIWRRTGDVYAFNLPIDHSTTSLYAQIVRMITPIPIILLLFKVSRYIKTENQITIWISSNSLSIYAAHFIWIYTLTDMLTSNFATYTTWNICICFAGTTLLTWITITLINRFNWLRRIVFGR